MTTENSESAPLLSLAAELLVGQVPCGTEDEMWWYEVNEDGTPQYRGRQLTEDEMTAYRQVLDFMDPPASGSKETR